MNQAAAPEIASRPLTKKDFESDQDVRWCPGCGDYAILSQVQKVLPELGIPREKLVFISGIGCSSRFPYYMNTYGFHTIHGRAPAIASGLRASRPDLSVWVITGDGDALSIGGNHFIHLLRRNLDVRILLFNNRIYGLTKGQYSPTSELGKVTASTPMGSIDYPFNPISLALGAEATFVARTLDRDLAHLHETLRRAAAHRGTAFVEIYQNCNIFNDGAFEVFTEKETKLAHVARLEHGKPILYGPKNEKGIRLKGFQLESIDLSKAEARMEDLLVYDAHCPDATLAMIVSRMTGENNLPLPIGVFRSVSRPCYDDSLNEQVRKAKEMMGPGDLDELFNSGDTWVVQPSS
ncbi:MAG: 2-oxoacid:ferredoxin oxidoreductase subunit beta [Planctomycetes bacterium]|nr:2-oxoacid:ferredoxin oxidoreductase subunit beta [Planctomycetota bacterium]